MQNNSIKIKGATEHNLKNISLEIPTNQLIAVSGVSGSGKSSLAYDIIFKEGQRKYLETFSSYSRLLIGKLRKPNVLEIDGIGPAVAVDQKSIQRNQRSTVGTMTGIYDLLRLLFARYGKAETSIEPCKLERRLFSFNAAQGACPHCKGLGLEEVIDPEKLIKDPNLSLRKGALVITTPTGYTIYSQVTIDVMNQVCESEGFHVDIPWKDLSDFQKNIILNGSNKILIPFGKHTLESRMKWTGITAKPREEGYYKGILPIMTEILKRDRNDNIMRFVSSKTCRECQGSRLRKEALMVKIEGKNIADFNNYTLQEIHDYFEKHKESKIDILVQIGNEIRRKTKILTELGLGYLQLKRESTTLSGGESQRIRLVNQAHIQLSGMIYVLDEPSIGLHPSDNQHMIKLMRRLVENGNTVIVIEHDEDTLRSADWIIDIGPGAGPKGGKLLFNGPVKEFLQNNHNESETWKYLTHHKKIEREINPENTEKEWIRLQGARANNLKNINVQFLKSALNLVTGVSGAGKSSLVFESLIPALKNEKNENFSTISGNTTISSIIEIDQLPIGRTPRSNPATYTKLFDLIRDLFAAQPESKKRHYPKGRFSFNVEGGRCEACQGAGYQQIGMHFLGNVDIECEVCEGKRFNDETLEILYNGKNIKEILDLTFQEAEDFFQSEAAIYNIIKTTNKLGLGYLTLGQPATTLSGGEAQRVKLSAELSKGNTSAKNKKPGSKLYILDEPSTGLHFYDNQILLNSLQTLILQGHTVILIEHNSDFIRLADHVIDLGPGSGNEGGNLVFQGKVKDLIQCSSSLTGLSLKEENFVQQEKKKIEIHPFIEINNLRVNNIHNQNIKVKKNAINVVCGPSGSGKSSFAFDTLYAEGRNQYLDSLTSYVRSFLMVKTQYEFDSILGLMPTIAIKTQRNKHNPRSTVGIYSEMQDLLRLLYSRIGKEKDGKTTKRLSTDFSFNHQQTSCKSCKGLGKVLQADPEKYITHPEKTILKGALDGNKTARFYGDVYGQFVWTLKAAGDYLKIDFSVPFNELSKEAKAIAIKGLKDVQLNINWQYKRKNVEGIHPFKGEWKGFSWLIEDEYQRKHADHRGEEIEVLLSESLCPECQGNRLIPEVLEVKIEQVNIAEFCKLELSENLDLLKNWQQNLSENDRKTAAYLFEKMISKLEGIIELGLSYLQLDRQVSSLSGGELQRLTLATQIHSGLSGVCYILDEPTIGLHPKDVLKLKESILRLKENGNTVVIVEHDPEMIQLADYLIEFGPGGGSEGGKVVCNSEFSTAVSPTLNLISSLTKIEKVSIISNVTQYLKIFGACANNLKNINIQFPIGQITGIQGVSGSGKSSLAKEVLYKSYQNHQAVNCQKIEGLDYFDEVVMVEQGIENLSSMSSIASFTGIMDEIKSLFSSTKDAKTEGKKSTYFSYFAKESRCQQCNGSGLEKVAMDFMSDIVRSCPECQGKRFNAEVLQFKFNEKDISEVLDLNLKDALTFFKSEGKILKKIDIFNRLGLGYLKLGQSGDSLSSGEIQRLKLATDIANANGKQNLYILDEPSNGLHISDIEKLLLLMENIKQLGHTILVIEHNPMLLNYCDHIIELGPKGGKEGGFLMGR